MRIILVFAVFLASFRALSAQELTATEIVAKAEQLTRGKSSEGEITMTIVRPGYTRSMTIKSWSLGDDKAILLVTAPARDKGTAFLRTGREIWNWQPTIDRVVKMPPSMMSQSWMGSDFSNDDLVRRTSLEKDFTHKILKTESIDGREAYLIEMTPNKEAAVVWGKIKTWIDKKNFVQLKSEFYDEDGYLINTIYGKNIKLVSGKVLATRLEVIPEEEPGHKTIIEQNYIKFDVPLSPDFFTVRNIKRVQ